MHKRFRYLHLAFLLTFFAMGANAQTGDAGRLKRLYFNLYTDSIKTVLNFYVNVEGEYTNGRYLPLDARTVDITADNGAMSGNEWIAPKEIGFDKVTFRVVAKGRPELHDSITVWLKRGKDPRDEADGAEMDLPTPGSERKGRKR